MFVVMPMPLDSTTSEDMIKMLNDSTNFCNLSLGNHILKLPIMEGDYRVQAQENVLCISE